MSSLPYPQLCQICKMDSWCPGAAVNASQVCPDGKYSLPGSAASNDCNCPTKSSSQQKSSEPKQCVCDSGYYREYNPSVQLGGWTCTLCKPGEFCYDNTNKTCPAHSTSLGVAKSVQDCYCLPGFANASTQTEQVVLHRQRGDFTVCLAGRIASPVHRVWQVLLHLGIQGDQ